VRSTGPSIEVYDLGAQFRGADAEIATVERQSLAQGLFQTPLGPRREGDMACLLYTSDAADE